MIERLEAKLGFDKVRADISARCCTEYAAERVETEEFSTIPEEIHRRHLLTDEMRLILMLRAFTSACSMRSTARMRTMLRIPESFSSTPSRKASTPTSSTWRPASAPPQR